MHFLSSAMSTSCLCVSVSLCEVYEMSGLKRGVNHEEREEPRRRTESSEKILCDIRQPIGAGLRTRYPLKSFVLFVYLVV